MNRKRNKNIIAQKGQSLVEVALFFPVFLVLLAGMVEVSNILVTANKVTSATRASARFGANGGENYGMGVVALNTVTQTLETGEDVWDIWAIRGTVNGDGNGSDFVPGTWEFTHIYGISNTTKFDEVDEDAIRAQVLAQLKLDEEGKATSAADLRIVGTYAIHDIESILGLSAMPQYAEISSVDDLSVMRKTGVEIENTNGCDGFPIAVHEGIRSVTKPNFPSGTARSYESFIHHKPDVPLLDATEGMVFKIFNGAGPGNFGWLKWNTGINGGASDLANSLAWPGNAKDYTNHGDGGKVLPGQSHVVRGFIEAGDASDTQLSVGDWVASAQGNSAGQSGPVLDQHISRGRTLRLLVWNTGQGSGNNVIYNVSRFAIFRLHGYQLNSSGGGPWILAEFIRWDTSCGQ